jgi:hypothetical protein
MAGHRVIEKDQLLDMKSAGAERARAFLEASRKGPNDANPAITEQESVRRPRTSPKCRAATWSPPRSSTTAPSPRQKSRPPSLLVGDAGVEQPPGLPIGPVLAKAEGADPEKVDKEAQKAPKRRPGSAPAAEGPRASSPWLLRSHR